MTPTLRLTRLFIERLFGEGSHDIDVSFKLDARVTILHGLNGSGKTVTLSLLQAVWEGRYGAILAYPLTRMRLEFDDGTTLELAPDTSVKKGKARRITGILAKGGPRNHLMLDADVSPRELIEILKSLGEAVYPLGPDMYLLPEREERLNEAQLRARFAPLIKDHPHLQRALGGEPEALRVLRARLPPMRFIRTDRLRVEAKDNADRGSRRPSRLTTSPDTNHMVTHLSAKLRNEVRDADRAYREISTERDTSLPERILEPPSDAPSAEALLDHARALGALEKRLIDVGLLTHTTKPLPAGISESQRATLHLILQDREAKLKPFEALLNKAERLLTSLNQKLYPKRVSLDLNTGYKVCAASGAPLDLTQLSSGEQHELVLLHELLFDVLPGSLVLIDEPELSLHVSWQATMLADLLDIARLVGVDFVLATHSPYIIGERDELMVGLGRAIEPST